VPREPRLVPSADLPAWFRARGISFLEAGRLALGFGADRPQYRLFDYPAPAPRETMGIFFEWHTKDFFSDPRGPHLAVGLRGPRPDDPHRGRGLALGVLAASATDSDGNTRPLFAGCPEAPGGPALFLEEFTVNDGVRPVEEWQLSHCIPVPGLAGDGVYRVDLHVAQAEVWAAVWKREAGGYRFLAQACCAENPPRRAGHAAPSPREHPEDRGQGNAFIGNGFADPDNLSFVDHVVIAHWPTY
jgi:hypothetical protein